MNQIYKKLLLLSALLTLSIPALKAQVGIGTTTPSSSAALELKATDKGFLVPRMTSTQRNAISSPAKGLMVFDNDSSYFFYHDGSAWKGLKNTDKAANYWSRSGSSTTVGNTGDNVGIGTSSPNGTAKLDISSTTSGILIPRMTTTQRNAISSPATGLMVYDNTLNSFYFYNSSTWVALASGGASPWSSSSGNTVLVNSTDKVGVGKTPSSKLDVDGMTNSDSFGTGGNRILSIKGSANTLLGQNAATKNTGSNNTIIGNGAGASQRSAGNNTLVGANAGNGITTGSNNIMMGRGTGQNLTTGHDNVIVGNSNGQNMNGADNTAVGSGAGFNLSNGGQNALYGENAGASTTNGSGVTSVGTYSGTTNTTGSYNTYLGYSSNTSNSNLTNATAIGANSSVNASNSVILGNNARVGIGTSSPSAKLEVNGSVKLDSLAGGGTKMVVTDNNGVLSTQTIPTGTTYTGSNGVTVSGSNITLGGNLSSPTTINTSSTNTLTLNGVQTGTTSDSLLQVSNGIVKKTAYPAIPNQWTTSGSNIYNANSGNVGVGTTSPGVKLDVTSTSGTGIRLLSGGSSNATGFQIGRTAAEGTLGIANGSGSYSGSAVAGDVVLRTETTSNRLHFNNGTGTAAMTLYNGTVGINGVTTPNGKLAVNGKTVLGDNSLSLNDINDDLYIEKNGNYTQLHLYNTDGSNTDVNGYLSMNRTGSNSGFSNSTPGFNLWTSSAHPMRFATNQTERMVILSNGLIGINKTSPVTRFNVAGAIRFDTLAGTGSRMVITDANGLLSTQTIPSTTTYTGSNGVTVSGSNITLGGNLSSPTKITTTSTNTLKLEGVQTGSGSDSVMLISNGVVKKMDRASITPTYTGGTGVSVSGTTINNTGVTSSSNGLTSTSGNVALGGALTAPTKITTSATNTLKLEGVQTGTTSDSLLQVSNGVIKKIAVSTAVPTYSAGSGISISSGTISNTGVLSSTSAGGDVSGTYSTLSVDKIKGTSVSSTAPTSGQVLKYNSSTSQWEPNTDNNTTYSAGSGITISSGTVANTGVVSTNNGITTTSGNAALGGNLSSPTTINTSSTNTLKLNGIQAGTTSDSVMLLSNGVVKKIDKATLAPTYTGGTGISVSGSTINNTGVTSSSNGLTTSSGNVVLGGNLSSPTKINTTSTNTLTLNGIQTGTTSDSLLQVSNGVVKKIAVPTAIPTYTAGSGISISSGTISNTGVLGSTSAGGDVSGTYSTLSVDKIKGTSVSSTAPTTGQVMKYNGTTWAPGTDNNTTTTGSNGVTVTGSNVTLGGNLTSPTTINTSSTNTLTLNGIQSGTSTDSLMVVSNGVVKKINNNTVISGTSAGGDLSGTYPNPGVNKIKGTAVSSTAPTSGQVLKYNSTTSQWEPNTDNNTTYSAGSGISISSGTVANTGVVTTNNGITTISGNAALGGNLSSPTTINTSSTNTLKLNGIQAGTTSDSVMLLSNGVVKKIAYPAAATNYWSRSGTTTSLANSGDAVGIGNSAPVGKLSVSGKLTSGDNSMTSNDANDDIYLEKNADYTQLHLFNTDGTNTDINGYLSMNRTGAGSGFGNSNPGMNLWTASDHPMRFATNGTERMVILSNGNIGVGTTAPGVLFDVVAPNAIGMRVLSGNSTALTGFQLGRSSADATFGVAAGSGNFSSSAAAGDLIIRTENPSQHLLLNSGSGAAGLSVIGPRVGVGLVAPVTRFEVNGAVRLDSLAGSGTRMVVTDASGTLSSQSIPSSTTYTGSNGVTISGSNVTLGGTLSAPTSINTTSTNTLKLNGVQTGTTSDSLLQVSNGVVKKIAVSTAVPTYSAGSGISISSGTISNTGVLGSTSAGGDVSGTYSALSVDKIKGTSVSSTAPTTGQVMKYNGSTWAPGTDNNTTTTGSNGVTVTGSNVTLGGNLTSPTTINTSSTNTLTLNGIQSGTSTDSLMVVSNGVVKKINNNTITSGTSAGGDLSGTYPNPGVNKIKGTAVSSTAPTSGQVLKYNSTTSQWEPNTDNNTTYSAGTGISISSGTVANTGVVTTSNGITTTSGNAALGGVLTAPTKITTTSTNTLKLEGIQSGSGSDSVMVISSGVLKKVDRAGFAGANYFSRSGSSIYTATTGDMITADSFGLGSSRVISVKGTNNLFVGVNLGIQATGSDNTLMGKYSGQNMTTGSGNVAVGNNTIASNQIGGNITALGTGALHDNQKSGNTGLGYGAGYSNNSGTNNLFAGDSAGYFNTSGSANSYVGYQAGRYNLTGTNNTGLGFRALDNPYYNSYGTAIGSNSMALSTGSSYCTAVGVYSLLNNGGNDNTGIGGNALYYNTSGARNVAVGVSASLLNTTGSNNVSVGNSALIVNSTGGYNVALGNYSMFQNTSSGNTAVGFYSGYNNSTGLGNAYMGDSAGYNSTTGNNNTIFGHRSGTTNTTGSKITLLGSKANVSSANLSNATAIGYNATVGASNSLVLGNGARVGIGTTTPATAFQVAGAVKIDTLAGTGTRMVVTDANGILSTQAIPSGGSGTSPWSRSGTNTSLVNSGDNVGVGTSSPVGKFSVVGKGTFGDNSLTSNDGNDDIYIEKDGVYNQIHIYNTNSTNPDINAYLSVNRSGNNNGTGNSNGGVNLWTASAHPIRIATAGSERMTIMANGLVGVGTATPSTKFNVNGAIKFDTLAGSSTRMVIADANGVLSTATIPSGGSGGSYFSRTGSVVSTLYSGDLVSADSFGIGGTSVLTVKGTGNTKVGMFAGGRSTSVYTTNVGMYAGYNAGSSAGYNVNIGNSAGYKNIVGQYTTFVGNGAGYNNFSSRMTGLGYNALYTNSSGSYNTAVGYVSLFGNTTGSFNTAMGDNSGAANTTGGNNTAIGAWALATNTTGSYNTAMGSGAMDMHNGGVANTAVGYNSQYYNYSKSSTTSVGSGSLYYGGGGYTTAVGWGAGSLSLSINSVFIGDSAGYSSTGHWNTFIGSMSGGKTTTGNQNTFLGCFTGTSNFFGARNVLIGHSSGSKMTTDENTMIGCESGFNSTTAAGGTFLGFHSGYNNTTGDYNTFAGWASGASNTTGFYNAFFGSGSGYSNTTGYRNSFFGQWAGINSTTGFNNTLIGNRAGLNSTTGSNNVMVGDSTGTQNYGGYYNTLLGSKAGYNSNSSANTFIGYLSGGANTYGSENTYVGFLAGANASGLIGSGGYTGNENVLVGGRCGYNSRIGNYNTLIGNYAGNSAANYVSRTVAVGNSSLFTVRGNGNVAMGYASGNTVYTGTENTLIGDSAGFTTYSGKNNVFLGANAGKANYSGLNNISIGYNATFGSNNLSNAISIGAFASAGANNSVVIGNSAMTSIGGQVGWSTLSDGRFKKNVEEYKLGLDFITKLRPVSYVYKNNDNGIRYDGFIAQEVEKTLQGMGVEFSGLCKPQNEKDNYSIRYGDFVVPLVNAVKELNVDNQALKASNTQLKTENETLKSELNSVKSLVEQVRDAQIACCRAQGNLEAAAKLDVAVLEQNNPNPFTESATIRYYLPQSTQSSTLTITDLNGKVLNSYKLQGTGNGQVLVLGNMFAAGTYNYNLVVNGVQVDTKRMILVK